MKSIFRRLGLIDIQGLILLAALVFHGGTLAGDPGLGWHIRAGQWIAENAAVPRSDPFLLTARGQSWIHDQWLSDLLFWQVTKLGGLPLLHAMTIVTVIVAYVLILASLAGRFSENRVLIFLATFLSALNGSVQWFTRPVIISFLLFTITYSALYRILRNSKSTEDLRHGVVARKTWVFLPLLFLLWSNLHPGFMLGLVLLAAFSAQFLWNLTGAKLRSLSVAQLTQVLSLSLLCVGATLLNPYGFSLYQSILQLGANSYFMNLNVEWLSTDFYSQLFLPFLISIVLLMGLAIRTRGRVLSGFDAVLVSFFLFMGLMQRRYIPFFGVVSVVPIIKLTEQLLEGGAFRKFSSISIALRNISVRDRTASVSRYTLAAALAVVAATALQHHLPGRSDEASDFPPSFPHKALAQIAASGRIGAIFHTPDWGGFITYTLWPKYQAFIDDRNQLSPTELYEEYFRLDLAQPGWQGILDKYQFRWLLLTNNSPLKLLIDTDSNWRKIGSAPEENSATQSDEAIILFERTTTAS